MLCTVCEFVLPARRQAAYSGRARSSADTTASSLLCFQEAVPGLVIRSVGQGSSWGGPLGGLIPFYDLRNTTLLVQSCIGVTDLATPRY